MRRGLGWVWHILRRLGLLCFRRLVLLLGRFAVVRLGVFLVARLCLRGIRLVVVFWRRLVCLFLGLARFGDEVRGVQVLLRA